MLLVFQVINQLTETLFPYVNLCYVLRKVGFILLWVRWSKIMEFVIDLEPTQSEINRKGWWSEQDVRATERADIGIW